MIERAAQGSFQWFQENAYEFKQFLLIFLHPAAEIHMNTGINASSSDTVLLMNVTGWLLAVLTTSPSPEKIRSASRYALAHRCAERSMKRCIDEITPGVRLIQLKCDGHYIPDIHGFPVLFARCPSGHHSDNSHGFGIQLRISLLQHTDITN